MNIHRPAVLAIVAVPTAVLLLASPTLAKKSPKVAMQFDHIGIVTTEKKAGERFVPATKVWVTDFQKHPFHIEWLRFEPDSPVKSPSAFQRHGDRIA
jgi:hypothetical protein